MANRVKAHNTSKGGAKYTKSRQPVRLVWFNQMSSKSQAFKEEWKIKKMKKVDKEALVDSFNVDNHAIDD